MKVVLLIILSMFLILFYSCSSDEGVPQVDLPIVSSITLSVDDSSVLIGETVIFLVTSNLSTNVTSGATIFVNGSAINGKSFTSNEEGAIEVYATYEDLTSNSLNITFTNDETPADSYKRNVLVEYFTGTWCGFCPRVSYSLGLVHNESEYVIPVALHGGSADPFIRVNDGELKELVEFGGYPTSVINRNMHWQTPEPEFINQITDLAGTETNVGIKINSSIDNGTINVSVDVNFGIDYGDLRLVVYLIEDNLIYSQNNYYPNLYGGQNPIQNFEHNNVLSDIYTSFMGENIPSPQSGEEQTFSYSKPLTEFVEDQANTRIVAFVIDETINTCLNVRSAKLGETIEYQLYN